VDKKKDLKTGEMKVKPGANRFVWNMRYEDAERFDNLILWAGGIQGPRAIPSMYKVRLNIDGKAQTQDFEILKDPRISSTQADLQAQLEFLLEIREKLTETHKAVKQIRTVREQINAYTKRLEAQKESHKDLFDKAKDINQKLTKIEETLYQTKNQSGQDPLNYPIRLNNKLSALASAAGNGDFRPTDQMHIVKNDITALINAELDKLKTIINAEIPAFNQLVQSKQIPAVVTEQEK
jgi:hypothetical protein